MDGSAVEQAKSTTTAEAGGAGDVPAQVRRMDASAYTSIAQGAAAFDSKVTASITAHPADTARLLGLRDKVRGTAQELQKKLAELKSGKFAVLFQQGEKGQEAVREEEIQRLEREVGIETEEDRLMEASLFIDKKFADVALITGQDVAVERIFGNAAWADYLSARAYIKEHGGSELTTDFMQELHRRLSQRTNPTVAGTYRERMTGGDYKNVGFPTTMTKEEQEIIESNPYLKTQVTGYDNSNIRQIIYPNNAGGDIGRYNLSEKAQQLYAEKGQTDTALVEALMGDLCDWYNEARKTEDPYQLAASLQRRIVSIHPFKDANGRLSRLLMNWSLEGNGIAPSVLEEPNDDIFCSEGEWMGQVWHGSRNYENIQKRRLAMEQAGIKDVVELMGLDEERTFYNYVFKTVQKAPQFPQGKILSHKELEAYKKNLGEEMKRFKGEFTADSVILDPERHMTAYLTDTDPQKNAKTIHQGGLIGETYINSVRDSTPRSTNYVRDNFFQETDLYRGGMTSEAISDDVLCRMFQEYVGIGTSYRGLNNVAISPDSMRKVSNEAVVDTLVDYNTIVSQSYLAKHHFPRILASDMAMWKPAIHEIAGGKNPFVVLKDFARGAYFGNIAHNHKFGLAIENSPFVSASTAVDAAAAFSNERLSKESSPRYAVRLTMKLPQEGAVMGFRTNTVRLRNDADKKRTSPLLSYSVEQSDIPAIINQRLFGAAWNEIYVPGGVDPRSITQIIAFEKVKEEERGVATHVARRGKDEEGDYVMVTDYRENKKEGVKRKYRIDEKTNRFILESLQPNNTEANAA